MGLTTAYKHYNDANKVGIFFYHKNSADGTYSLYECLITIDTQEVFLKKSNPTFIPITLSLFHFDDGLPVAAFITYTKGVDRFGS